MTKMEMVMEVDLDLMEETCQFFEFLNKKK
jgi:hypothetical protein